MTVTDAIKQLVYEMRRAGVGEDGPPVIELRTFDDGMRLEMQLEAENRIADEHLVIDTPRDPNSLEICGVLVRWPKRLR